MQVTMVHLAKTFNPLLKGLIMLAIVLTGFGCEEEGPDIKLEPDPDKTKADSANRQLLNDTTYKANKDSSEQAKNVLIEDFTGIRCNNCPKATDNIKALKKEYGDRVMALGIHCNIRYSRPYENSKENYRIAKGQSLYEAFGKPAQPAGMIDRFDFDGSSGEQGDPILDYQQWESKAPERLKKTSKVNLYLKQFVNKKEDQVLLKVKAYFNEAIDKRVNLTVALTEDNIIDYQLTPEEKVKDYEHNHVLRKILTPHLGTKLWENPESRQIVERGFQFTIEDNWKLENLNAVAFVHFNQPEHTILQTQKTDF